MYKLRDNSFRRYSSIPFKFLIAATLLAILLLLLGACSKNPGAYYEQFLGFGTLIEVKIWGVSEEQGKQLVNVVAEDINFMHRVWHAWKPGSLSRVNDLIKTGEKFTMGPAVIPVLKEAKKLSELSGDLFNPAIGNLIKLWGFADDKLPEGPPPLEEKIKALLDKKLSMKDIVIEGIELQSFNPEIRLDLGGFAKGFAVDLIIAHLKDLGVKNVIVNAGGDLRAIGSHGERPWRVGIRDPRGEGVLASVDALADESIFTSGDYERFYEYNGQRYHHIIDPRSGYPARGVTSVTIFDTQAGRADAAATAIFVAGVDGWLDVARKMGVSGVMLIADDGKVYMTPNLKERIYFDVDPVPEVILSDPL